MGCSGSVSDGAAGPNELSAKYKTKRPETPTKQWVREDSPLQQYRLAISAHGRLYADCHYYTIAEDGSIERMRNCGLGTHGTIDDGECVVGRVVVHEGEEWLDLGIGVVPTGPRSYVGEQAPEIRKLLPLRLLHRVISTDATVLPSYWWNAERRYFKECVDVEPEFNAVLQQMFDDTWKPTATRDRQGRIPSGLRLVRAQRLEHSTQWGKYQGEVIRLQERWPEGCRPIPEVKTTRSLEGTKYRERLNPQVTECYLFHGTTPEAAQGIIDRGFEMACIGSHRGTAFGHGFYFAESASKADEYARDGTGVYSGLYAMLLCRVAMGESFTVMEKGDPEIKRALMSGRYDSALADREGAVGTYREFVVFSHAAIYPEYVLLYEHLEEDE